LDFCAALATSSMIENDLSPIGPSAWLCGDLHLENFGTYLGDNGLSYFDINDFDEAVRAPNTWDILRLATSVIVAAPVLGIKPGNVAALVEDLIATYGRELTTGKARWIERRTAEGLIGALIGNLKKRDTARLLGKRTTLKGDTRTLKIDGEKALAIAKTERMALRAFCEHLASGSGKPSAFTFLDAARRIAGNGSLGIQRFVILVEGAGSPDHNWLLDFKEAAPATIARHVQDPQPTWESEAHRVAAIQSLMQANPPDLLSAHLYNGKPFVLKQLQPSADRLDLAAEAPDIPAFGDVLSTMAKLTAWAHLRGSGRYGASAADALIAAAPTQTKAVTDLKRRATALAAINATDWKDYCIAFDEGLFALP
jgi:uncharacterized protein (DUF2252 family)